MKRFLGWFSILLYSAAHGQFIPWDDATAKNWPTGFIALNIKSSYDSTTQPSIIYAAKGSKKQPLISSLHTWNGTYLQTDSLAAEAK